MKIYLIRHGKTAGNLAGRYIGTTDEPLCPEGREELARGRYPFAVEALYVSPLLRCRQSADILFPGVAQHVAEDFRECDFGRFENKNYRELAGDADYQAWLESGGTLPFPGGESREAFQDRCVRVFANVLRREAGARCSALACVVHGGTIMSILSRLAYPQRGYFDYQVKNGCGYAVDWNTEDDVLHACAEGIVLSVCGELTLRQR